MISYPPSLLAPFFSVKENVVTATGSGALLCGLNPDRVMLILSNDITTNVFAATNKGTLTTGGIQLGTGPTPLILYFSLHGALVCQTWWGMVRGAGQPSNVTVIEVIYRPVPRSE